MTGAGGEGERMPPAGAEGAAHGGQPSASGERMPQEGAWEPGADLGVGAHDATGAADPRACAGAARGTADASDPRGTADASDPPHTGQPGVDVPDRRGTTDASDPRVTGGAADPPNTTDATDPPHTGQPGVDVPDRRGRTGLDRVGRDLDRNPRVVVRDVRVLTSNWFVTRATTFDFRHADGTWSTEERETYDRGDGATILLYDAAARTVLLTRQFRYPAYVNEHPDGMLIETAAGLLDTDDAETAIRREAEEEIGAPVGDVERVFDVYMSPGSITERLHFFAAPYRHGDVAHGSRAGLAEEGEDIEVIELDFDDALTRIGIDIVDAKTIMLLQWAALRGPFAPRP